MTYGTCTEIWSFFGKETCNKGYIICVGKNMGNRQWASLNKGFLTTIIPFKVLRDNFCHAYWHQRKQLTVSLFKFKNGKRYLGTHFLNIKSHRNPLGVDKCSAREKILNVYELCSKGCNFKWQEWWEISRHKFGRLYIVSCNLILEVIGTY